MRSAKKIIGVLVLMIVGILCVPNNVNAAEMSAKFKEILNDKNQFIADCVPPTDDFHFEVLVNEYLLIAKGLGDYSISNCNSSYTLCEMTYWSDSQTKETHNIEVVYNYDKAIKKEFDEFIKDFPIDRDYFKVSDLEVINYWINSMNSNSRNAMLANYSGELKKYLNHNNFIFEISVRGGSSGDPFSTERIGIATLRYGDTYYFIDPMLGVRADYIMYVPDETENTKEAIMAAAQKRINDYVTSGPFNVDLTYGGTAYEYWLNYHYEETKEMWEVEQGADLTIEEFEQLGNIYLPAYNSFEENFEDLFGIAGIAEDDMYFIADVYDEGMGEAFNLFIKKDSSKMINPSYKSADLSTNVEISTDANIPLDTFIQATEITSGEEYEKIVKLLNVDDNLTFDLKLYSESLSKYITTLSDGNFEVKIPIPESFEGKDLKVYYVGASGKPEEFKVTEENGYAVFTTNHFSVYTLGYKDETTPIKVTLNANGGTFENDDIYIINDWDYTLYDSLLKPTRKGYTFKGYYTEKTGGTKFENILNEAGIYEDMIFYAQWEKETKNPETFDGITRSILFIILSLVGIIATIIYIKKKAN